MNGVSALADQPSWAFGQGAGEPPFRAADLVNQALGRTIELRLYSKLVASLPSTLSMPIRDIATVSSDA